MPLGKQKLQEIQITPIMELDSVLSWIVIGFAMDCQYILKGGL